MAPAERGRRQLLRALAAGSSALAAGCLTAVDPGEPSGSDPDGDRPAAAGSRDGMGALAGGSDPPADTGNVLEATGHIPDQTHVTRYSTATAAAAVHGWPAVPYDRVRIACYAMVYPRGEIVAAGTSRAFATPAEADDPVDVGVDLDRGSIPEDVRLHHALRAIPADRDAGTAPRSERYLVAETDPFVVTDGQIARSPPDHALDVAGMSSFERRPVEGAYDLTFSGRTAGREWSTGLFVYKSAYGVTRRRSTRDNDSLGYGDYVTIAHENGNAVTLARALETLAARNGFAGKRARTNFVVDFVQSMPYTDDDVTSGFDEYPRFPTETLVEGGGDCEDTSILLVSMLEAAPFGYDAVMIGPPGHMGVGIHGEDLSGAYWEHGGRRYYYVETTGSGWRIGDLPDPYRGTEARIWQVP